MFRTKKSASPEFCRELPDIINILAVVSDTDSTAVIRLRSGTIDNSYNPITDENNYNTRLPRVSATNSINNTYPSNMFLFNCSYLRLKNLQVYYNLPNQILDKVNISRAKIYFSGQNLYTLSALPKALGVDPEIGSATAGYPLVKVLSFGLDVTF